MVVIDFRILLHRLKRLAVAAQQKQILDAEEVEVEQRILSLLLREPLADDMRHGLNSILVLYRGRDGHCARALAHAHTAETAVGLFLIYILTVMRRDIDIRRIEILQTVDDVIHLEDTVAFQRRQNLKRELRALPAPCGNCFIYTHNSVILMIGQ